jgi:hypothetical protein
VGFYLGLLGEFLAGPAAARRRESSASSASANTIRTCVEVLPATSPTVPPPRSGHRATVLATPYNEPPERFCPRAPRAAGAPTGACSIPRTEVLDAVIALDGA